MKVAELAKLCRDKSSSFTIELAEVEFGDVERMLNSEITDINYYWYHHMMDNLTRSKIQSSFCNYDYSTWRYFKDRLNRGITYLPSTASVYCNNEYVGEILINCPELFNLITYSECECG